MHRIHFHICPRCECRAYERLHTYSHCFDCGYSSDFSYAY